ncbi:leupaxin-like [Saccoglossus kowalevskii]|uniref:PDZ and LIM domain protein 7-like n=1 Tax=Saccoglossus kowalevskii TaxID=10224 RepID=A0ABM0GVP6_SACKO|nr:PREDICTED: PDZ and LIM domain protein 7-like [Saccoglossus kowalevskii]
MPVCEKCKKTITGTIVTALDKEWHAECFRCAECRCQLRGKSFFTTKDGRVVCETDYKIFEAARCAKCYESVTGEIVTALDKKWHPHCFVCNHCRKPFGGDGFMVKDDKPYCKKDYQVLFCGGKDVKVVSSDICYGCDQKLGSKWVEAMNQNWHPDCFVCQKCREKLSGEKFYNESGKPVCTKCG